MQPLEAHNGEIIGMNDVLQSQVEFLGLEVHASSHIRIKMDGTESLRSNEVPLRVGGNFRQRIGTFELYELESLKGPIRPTHSLRESYFRMVGVPGEAQEVCEVTPVKACGRKDDGLPPTQIKHKA